MGAERESKKEREKKERQKEREMLQRSSLFFFCKGINPITGPHTMTSFNWFPHPHSQSHHLQIPSHWDLGLIWILERHICSVSSRRVLSRLVTERMFVQFYTQQQPKKQKTQTKPTNSKQIPFSECFLKCKISFSISFYWLFFETNLWWIFGSHEEIRK